MSHAIARILPARSARTARPVEMPVRGLPPLLRSEAFAEDLPDPEPPRRRATWLAPLSVMLISTLAWLLTITSTVAA